MLKNITFNAEERLIQQAREKAKLEKKSLNSAFREWLISYINQNKTNYNEIMQQLNYVKAGRKYCRDELNER